MFWESGGNLQGWTCLPGGILQNRELGKMCVIAQSGENRAETTIPRGDNPTGYCVKQEPLDSAV
ncbi:MAG: hypothetical protein OEV64_02125 [Desulfobulbaceae bacterium]|nr:hypothetical protein [Desulfobulbaceae bacterium]